MRTAIVNGKVISPNTEFYGGVICENDKIIALFEGELSEKVDEIIDAGGAYITPGFIDIHTHGAGGKNFLGDKVEDFELAAKTHLKFGMTALMPTSITSTPESMIETLDTYEKAKDLPGMPEFLGMHLEGPYFSYEQRGAQDPNYIRNPDPKEYMTILDTYDCVKRWSVAIELPGAMEFGLELQKRGIIASVGHSDAIYDDMRRAADYGYTFITHFYSGMSGVRRINAYRHAGVIESGYLMDDFGVEVIADGHHLPPSLLKLIYKVKGSSNMCLVTDSISAAGTDMTETMLGEVYAIIEDGVAKLPDRSAFAGSVATANMLIKTMVELCELPISEAVKMYTLTPARIAGVADRMGSLTPGKTANIVILNQDFSVKKVILKGVAI